MKLNARAVAHPGTAGGVRAGRPARQAASALDPGEPGRDVEQLVALRVRLHGPRHGH
jgi:hypothetical protein